MERIRSDRRFLFVAIRTIVVAVVVVPAVDGTSFVVEVVFPSILMLILLLLLISCRRLLDLDLVIAPETDPDDDDDEVDDDIDRVDGWSYCCCWVSLDKFSMVA